MQLKIFKDLIKEVHDIGICQQCGGCVSFCNSLVYDIIGFKDLNSPPVYLNENKCLKCGICYYICPQTHILDYNINETFKFSDFNSMPLGNFDKLYSCQAIDKAFLNNGTDGGVVNSILNFLLKKKLIDGAIVAKTKHPFCRESVYAKSKEDLIEASGVNLNVSRQLEQVQKFYTYISTVKKLNHYRFEKLAIVGTPCQIYTIRCMQNLGIIPSQNIEICLGLFCYENFIFDKFKMLEFEKDFDVKFKNIEKINIKEDLIIKLKDKEIGQKTIHIPFNQLKNYMRPACNACDDFTNIYADISFGGLGSQEKFTTIITRTEKGKKVFSKAIEAGVIKAKALNAETKQSMINLLTQYSRAKVKRKENFMLNRLSEFKKRLIIDLYSAS
jgi:coenzyme F420 hydrogenase subunit beta